MTLFGGIAGLAVDAMARPATRLRQEPGTYVGGQWVEGASVSEAIRAVVQDPKEADIRQLPEGERTEAYATIWTRADLFTADEANQIEADRVITEAGDTYKIIRVSERTEAGFTRAIARLEHARGRGLRPASHVPGEAGE